MAPGSTNPTDDVDPLELRLNELYATLEDTAELPIDREANRWLGEAEAVARDAATSDLDADVARERVREVERLLAEVGDVESERAREHVEEARALCERILEEEK